MYVFQASYELVSHLIKCHIWDVVLHNTNKHQWQLKVSYWYLQDRRVCEDFILNKQEQEVSLFIVHRYL